jgi:GNAT superfamily N-acetyltransferase
MIGTDKIGVREVDSEFAGKLNRIGFYSWADAMEQTRTGGEVGHFFPIGGNGTSPAEKRKLGGYKRFARHGSMAQNDVSGALLERTYKRLRRPDKEYAWLAQVNVLPEFQGKGIGRRLVREVLEGFRSEQTVTTYIFRENDLVWNLALKHGFSLDPEEQEPQEVIDYFGPEAKPVEQFRFSAPSVAQLYASLRPPRSST